ncbi:MAG: Sec-independent protein translocase protein TatA [Myxococcota bacterium]|nr:Sec-independent protein translocase protein TatA [Myxococcota bacterium]
MLGWTEILLLTLVIVILFGANKIPQLGRALGEGIRNFKRSTSGQDEIDVTPPKGRITEAEDSKNPAKS